MQIDLNKMKADVGYDPDAPAREAFASKWAAHLDEETVELIELFATQRVEAGFGKKGAASAKSLIMRYLATGEWSKGKSGASQKSHVRAFIRWAEKFAVEQDDETTA